jgi:hypothetical protein
VNSPEFIHVYARPRFGTFVLDVASKAIGTFGHLSSVGDHLISVETTPQRHNMVV